MKKKLKLDLESMKVESFDTDEALKGRGTVRGNSGVSSDCSFDPPDTCDRWQTCWDSCGGSCDSICSPPPSYYYYNGVCV